MNSSPDLNPARRSRELQQLAGEGVDLLVIGGGITGCGVALDAASRGLSVALLEREDLASGTSGFSSKLVHGGLRYLAQGQFGVAAESARERHHLMTTIAPHLIEPVASVIPFDGSNSRLERATLRIGYKLGDGLRRSAGTPRELLGRSHRINAFEASSRIPGLKTQGLDGALIGWDGRLEDDARLVIAVARTAAAHGAKIITRCAATAVERGQVSARDELTGESLTIRAGHTINATGVWSGELASGVRVTPSKGSHVIVTAQSMGNPAGSLTLPAQGGGAKYVFAIPTADQTVMIGLTDTEYEGGLSAPPQADDWEIDLLLGTISSALETPITRADVVGSFAGLRPLLVPEDGSAAGKTSDVSREHAVIEDPDSGMITVVGGKLTTYRKMAEDAVSRVSQRPCATKTLPLVGALGAPTDDRALPARVLRRLGAEAFRVLTLTEGDHSLLEPAVRGSEITPAELRFSAAYELALSADDLLDRRTRAGLTPAIRRELSGAAEDALAWAASTCNDDHQGTPHDIAAASN